MVKSSRKVDVPVNIEVVAGCCVVDTDATRRRIHVEVARAHFDIGTIVEGICAVRPKGTHERCTPLVKGPRKIDVSTNIECIRRVGDTYAYTPLLENNIGFTRVGPLCPVRNLKVAYFTTIGGRRRKVDVFPVHIGCLTLDVLVKELSGRTHTDHDSPAFVIDRDLLPIFCGREEPRDRGFCERGPIVLKGDFVVIVIERERVAVTSGRGGAKDIGIEGARTRSRANVHLKFHHPRIGELLTPIHIAIREIEIPIGRVTNTGCTRKPRECRRRSLVVVDEDRVGSRHIEGGIHALNVGNLQLAHTQRGILNI